MLNTDAVISEIIKTLFLFFRIDHYENRLTDCYVVMFYPSKPKSIGTDSKYISRKIRPIRICQLMVGVLNNNDIVNNHADEIVAIIANIKHNIYAKCGI